MSTSAFAWGLSDDLDANWAPAQLVFPVIKKHAIDYCIEVTDARYNHDSLKVEVEMALRRWLKAVSDAWVLGDELASQVW